MGFCYSHVGGRRLLVCEGCSAVGGVRKVPCPSGYCPATALCAVCRKSPTIKASLKESHSGCAAASAEFAAREAAEAAALAAGEYVFCVASGKPGGLVEMGFRSVSGEVLYLTVAEAIYRTAHSMKWKGGEVATMTVVEAMVSREGVAA